MPVLPPPAFTETVVEVFTLITPRFAGVTDLITGFASEESSSTLRLSVRLFVLPAPSLKSNVITYLPVVLGIQVVEAELLKFEITEVAPLGFVTENL